VAVANNSRANDRGGVGWVTARGRGRFRERITDRVGAQHNIKGSFKWFRRLVKTTTHYHGMLNIPMFLASF